VVLVRVQWATITPLLLLAFTSERGSIQAQFLLVEKKTWNSRRDQGQVSRKNSAMKVFKILLVALLNVVIVLSTCGVLTCH
jgi:hypothetical protein